MNIPLNSEQHTQNTSTLKASKKDDKWHNDEERTRRESKTNVENTKNIKDQNKQRTRHKKHNIQDKHKSIENIGTYKSTEIAEYENIEKIWKYNTHRK